jgi:Mrp family chromosome partitioning ATPase/capsular polysaccharide biosynthesis protein
MELVNYLRIVRRRWRLVAVFVIFGVAAGIGSSLFAGGSVKGPGPTYYLAKHTLSSSAGTANLSRDAALCTEGEVPKRVATKLGLDNPQSLAGKITCEPHPETNLLYIAAADNDAKRSVLLADSFAEQLVAYLRDVGEQLKQTKIDSINKNIDNLRSEYATTKTDEETTTDPTQKKLDGQRLTDLAKKINDLTDQKNNAASEPAATEALTTLSTAEAVPISQNAYDLLLNGGDTSKNAGKVGSPTQNATRQSQIDAAIKSGNPISLPSRVGLGAALGLVLGFALSIVLDRVDPRIRTKFEAEEAFGWPVIGEIPPLTRRERQQLTVFAYDEPRSRAAESYRVLRSAVLFAQVGDDMLDTEDVHPIFAFKAGDALAADAVVEETAADEAPVVPDDPAAIGDLAGPVRAGLSGPAPEKPRGQVIMVTSPGPSEGKTTTAANLAAILAETGRSVLVVNCDFRRPRIHLHLDAPNEPRQVVDTKISNVKLVSQVLDNANDANPAMVLQTQRQVIRNAREMFDIVLLDTAPLLTTNDATDVLSVADQVVIVVKSGKTHKQAADRAAELLERRNGPVLGVILVGATDVPTSRYYYYGDSPEGEEPEPGNETTSPFEALLDEITTTTKVAAANNADRPEQVVFGPSTPASSSGTLDGSATDGTTKTDTAIDTKTDTKTAITTDASTATTADGLPSDPASDASDAPSPNAADLAKGNGNGNGPDGGNGAGNGSRRARRSKKSGGPGSDGPPESLRGR